MRVGTSVILLALLLKFTKIDVHQVLSEVKNADKGGLAFAFVILFFSYVLALFRWEMLLKALKIELPLSRVLASYAAGVFFNLFLPSSIGGDFMRTLDLSTHTGKPKQVVATVFLDRLSGYMGLVLMAACSLILGWRFISDKSVLLPIAVISGLLVLILLILFNRPLYARISRLLDNPGAGKIREGIKELHQEIHYIRDNKRVIINNLAFSVLIQAGGPLSFFVISRSFGLKIDLIYFFIFLPVISAITLLPISIGGLGLREATTTLFFSKAGMDPHAAVTMALLNSFFTFVCGALGGLIYVFTLHHRRIQRHPSPSVQAPS